MASALRTDVYLKGKGRLAAREGWALPVLAASAGILGFTAMQASPLGAASRRVYKVLPAERFFTQAAGAGKHGVMSYLEIACRWG